MPVPIVPNVIMCEDMGQLVEAVLQLLMVDEKVKQLLLPSEPSSLYSSQPLEHARSISQM